MAEQKRLSSDLEVLAETVGFRSALPNEISGELLELMSRFAETDVTDSADPLSDNEHQRMLELMATTPGSTSLLRTLCNEAVTLADAGSLPDSVRQQWMNRIFPSQKPKTDFVVRLGSGGLTYSETSQSRLKISSSFQMARGDEKATTLTHSQRLSNCTIEVTIEAEPGQTFRIALKFTFVNPQYPKNSLSVLLTNEDGLASEEAVENDSAEFDDLPPGIYSGRIQSRGELIDEFSAELDMESPE